MAETTQSSKPKVAFYWCAACGGCEEAVVDLAENILDVVGAVDIVFWPVALDFKRSHVEALADGSILACFINGAVRTTEQEEMVQLLRRKSKLVVAYGACSHLGGIPGLANLWDRKSIFQAVYHEGPTTVNPEGTEPQTCFKEDGRTATLPGFFNTVRALDQAVDVDYYIPGCAPTPKVTLAALQTLLSGNLPAKGTVLTKDEALCEECPRKDSRPEKLTLSEFKRPHQVLIDESKCMIALLGLHPLKSLDAEYCHQQRTAKMGDDDRRSPRILAAQQQRDGLCRKSRESGQSAKKARDDKQPPFR